MFVTLPVSSCKNMHMRVPVVTDWEGDGAPAGSWAQASVSRLALVTDVVAGSSAAVSEAQPELFLTGEKDL